MDCRGACSTRTEGLGIRFWIPTLLYFTIAFLPNHLKAVAPTLVAADISFTADDQVEIYINGNPVGGGSGYFPCAGSCYSVITNVDLPVGFFAPCNVIAAADFDFAGGQGFFSFDISLHWSDGT